MSEGRCALHLERPSTFVCPRCGDYGCDACAHRVQEGAVPLCPGCWKKREEHVTAIVGRERRFLAVAALVVGCAALIPCVWPLQVGGMILGTIALVRARRNGDSRGQAFAAAGIALSVVGAAGSVILLALGAFP